MPNKKSVEKSLRQSERKRAHNLMWGQRISSMRKALRKALETKDTDAVILKKHEVELQKVLDKAAKVKAIHKNKAARHKSRLAVRVQKQVKAA